MSYSPYPSSTNPEPYGTQIDKRPGYYYTSGRDPRSGISPPPKAPYYMPPYYPVPPLGKGPPMSEVDKLLPTVPFKYRPRALKITMVLFMIGIILCTLRVLRILPGFLFGGFILFFYFVVIIILGVFSLIFLFIPKKIGWYLAFITSIIALGGFVIGSIIAIFALVSLLWPSVRYFFHTGQYPPIVPMMGPMQYNFPTYPNSYGNIPAIIHTSDQRQERELEYGSRRDRI